MHSAILVPHRNHQWVTCGIPQGWRPCSCGYHITKCIAANVDTTIAMHALTMRRVYDRVECAYRPRINLMVPPAKVDWARKYCTIPHRRICGEHCSSTMACSIRSSRKGSGLWRKSYTHFQDNKKGTFCGQHGETSRNRREGSQYRQ